MEEKGYYLYEADIDRHIYLKKETILSDIGHFHDSPEFVFMLDGEIESHNNQSIIVKSGEVCFADSFECHYYKKLTDKIKAIVLVLSNEYVALFRNLYKNYTIPQHLDNVEKNKKIFELMDKWEKEPNKDYMLNMGYCDILLSYIVENYNLIERESKKNKSVAIKLLKYIGENFTKPITLQSVADEMGYTKEYCSKIFSEDVGLHFRDYLNHLRIKRAKELFSIQKDTKQTSIEIIYDCGFNSTATFYRALKKGKERNIIF